MRPYWAVLKARFRLLLQYRAAAIAGLATQLFWGLMRVMIFTAFYRFSPGPHPLSLAETVSYLWLSQALLLLVPWNLDRDVEQLVRTGNIGYELLRPADLYWMWFARACALRLAPSLLRSLPMLAIALMFLGLQPPPSLASATAFLASLAGAVLVSSAITVLMNISLFWTVAGDGIARLGFTAAMFFSGLLIPLPLFPDWAQPVLDFLPFRGIMDVPFRLYLGNLTPGQAPALVAQQLLWALALVALGRLLLDKNLKRLAIQGG